jgi:hypothetical protein
MAWTNAKANKARINGRKRAILHAVSKGLDFDSIQLAEDLAGKFNKYTPAKSEFTLVLQTADGEFYTVEVKRSTYETPTS